MTRNVDAAAGMSVDELLAEHVTNYQSLFRRFSITVGKTAPELAARNTLERLEEYTRDKTSDPEFEALLDFGDDPQLREL